MKFEHLADPDGILVGALGATVLPEAFLFDGGGRLAYHGALDGLREAVEAVAARATIPMSETALDGCAILPGE